ncbi:CDP-Glycerol:Poly(Glycerophosphate) glycerophosphotransferase [Priestia megaterium]|uniref:CDP-glycerol glycerophosphotransferase family protein n=1 Tax=Priestia megaterium TaxID=1404 RepID=UPI0039E1BE62
MRQNILKAKYKKLKYVPMIILAIIINSIYKFKFKNKKVVLVGGHCGEKYQDNSAIIHQYILKTRQDVTTYWLVDNMENSYTKKIEGNMVKLGSLMNYLLYLNTNTCYFSHSLSTDIAPLIDKLLFNKYKPLRVHLSHGIEGLKKNIYYKKIEKVDFYICSSNREKEIKRDDWGIEENKLIVTGVPRYDNLERNRKKNIKKTILYAPTWREWLYLIRKEEFIKTDFFNSLLQLISNQSLNNMLEQTDYKLEIMLHPFMHGKLSILKEYLKATPNITILNEDENISQKIIESSLLITDYSSVCWDFLYLNKPIIFYQYDQERYLLERGAYIDLNKDLFGEIAFSTEDLIPYIEKFVFSKDINFLPDSKDYRLKREKYFAFFDDSNCKRVVDATLH